MAQHTIRVINGLNNKGGTGASGGRATKVSGKGSSQRVGATFRRMSNIPTSSNQASKAGENAGRAVASSNIVLAVIYMAAKVAVAGVNLYNNIQSAKTGNTIKTANTKKTLSYITSFGIGYVTDLFNNQVYTTKQIARDNIALDRDRELYGLNTYQNKYRGR